MNKNAYQYQETIGNQFNSICKPLYDLGIKWFGYIKIFPDGSYLLAAPGHKELFKQYYINIKSQGNAPTERIESAPIEKSHYALFSSNPIKKMDPVLHLLYSYDIWPVFGIYKNRSEYIEVYCFSMSKDEHHATEFYLNNLSLLECFCNYFDDRATDIIGCSDKQKLGYFEQTFNLQNQSKEIFRAQQIKQFFQETYIKQVDSKKKESEFFSSWEGMEGLNYLALGESVKEISGNLGIPSMIIEKSLQVFNDINKKKYYIPCTEEKNLISSLSPRQKECLFFLTRGKTAKQIGQALGISHRTVETHIISLKSKMNCTTKNQLVEKVFDMNKFSFPP